MMIERVAILCRLLANGGTDRMANPKMRPALMQRVAADPAGDASG